jgi:transcriptional regulator with XRE-family HTH domain
MTILVTSGDDQLAKERLAQLIKELRGSTTQREFAKLLGTSYTAIQDWEKEIRLPKENNLQRIAQLKGWTQEQLIRYLFALDDLPPRSSADSLEALIGQIQTLTLAQMQQLNACLTAQLSQVQSDRKRSMGPALSKKQKHNLHLLLRASLRHQSPTEAMAKAGIQPNLFTDIFLRDNTAQSVEYTDLEKFSGLCNRIICWAPHEPPVVDPEQTYLGETELLFKDLNKGDRVMLDSQ